MNKKISILVALMVTLQMLLSSINITVMAEEIYTEPDSPSVKYNMNIDWKFRKADLAKVFPLATALEGVAKDGKQFYEVGYDDSDWETVSVPHPINAEDSFDNLAGDAGEAGLYRGFMFYRKTITIPASDAGKKLFLEFEAVRQSVYLYVNGQMAGYYEAGIAPIGFDITEFVTPGEEALIAVATDNASSRGSTFNTQETVPGNEPGDLSGYGYQWNTKDFNEVQGGITGNVNLYAKNNVYQTLPLYNNLKTKGNYIYASDFDISKKQATINVEAEVRNESGEDKDITLDVAVVKQDGTLAYSFSQQASVPAAADAGIRYQNMVPQDAYEANPAPTDVSTVDVTVIKASFAAEDVRFWNIDDPYLYKVYTILKDGDQVIDVQTIETGFRQVTYDVNDGGLKINNKVTYLKGYAQRATNEWAVIGVANDWLSDYDMQLVRESNANYIRWMHVAPKPNAIRSGDKYGVVSIAPAGDKEGDVTGRAWDQRVEAMRDTIIYFRNSPSILFWEAGNQYITGEHMQEMTELRKTLDPNADRRMGCRSQLSADELQYAEWVGTMEAGGRSRAVATVKANMESIGLNVPILETEYHRNESPRRSWDDYTPPDYDYVNKWLDGSKSKEDGYDVWDQTQEDFVRTSANNYNSFYEDRVGGSTGNNYYSGAAMMVWSDSNMHTRNAATENCRTSGRVDPARVKKESFYGLQVMQSDEPMIHIVGHWNYPQLSDDTYNYRDKEWIQGSEFGYWQVTDNYLKRDPLNKTVYVAGTKDCEKIELYVNGELKGTATKPEDGYIFKFTGIDITQNGEISAKAYNIREEVIAEDSIKTAGEKYTIRLTPMAGPDGLRADGSDIIYFDVDIVDSEGNICPTAYDKINFSLEGEGVFLGGYNSGKFDSESVIWKDYVYAECGQTRVFVRSTRNAGNITLKAWWDGMAPVEITVSSEAVALSGGLTTLAQQSYAQGETPEPVEPVKAGPMKALTNVFTADFQSNVVFEQGGGETEDDYIITVNGETVECTNKPYENNGTIIGEMVTLLEAIKNAGAEFDYTYQTDGAIPDYLVSGKNPILTVISDGNTYVYSNGLTNVYVNGAMGSLQDNEYYVENDIFMGQLNSIVIPGVIFRINSEDKIFAVTVE